MRTTLLAAFLYSLTAFTAFTAFAADSQASLPDLSKISSRADLEAVIAATTDAAFKKALVDHADAILAAAEQRPHVEAVSRAIESSPGKYVKINATPAALKKAAGGDIPLFDTLTLVSTSILGGKPHVYRKGNEDPYDAEFIEHLGHILALESVRIVATGIEDTWLPPLLKLKNLKSFAKFQGWTKLKSINFHSNSLDDEGLGNVCEQFPNLEFIKLWHSHVITDASAEHLKKLSKLKGIEIGCHEATAAVLKHFNQLPLEYVGLSYGVNTPASDVIATLGSIPTLRRLLIRCDSFTDAELTMLASMTQLEELTLANLDLPEARLPQFQAFSFLKSITFTRNKEEPDFATETPEKIKALLPKVEVKFIKH